MTFRWSKGFSPLQTIKRGLTSLFVCSVVLLPLILVGIQLNGWLSNNDPRSSKPLSAMQVRPMDQTSEAIRPFEQPLITVTFDDGWESIYSQALPLLQQYGIPTTQYVLSGTSDNHSYMSWKQIKLASQAGHDIQCHSIDHADLTLLSSKDMLNELTSCKSEVENKVGVQVSDFASPYGASNESTIAAIKQHYRSHRNTNGDITTNAADRLDVNSKSNFDRYNITAVTIRRETTEAQLQSVVDYAVKNNSWLVLNYHQIDDGASQFALDSKVLERQFQILNRTQARIVTMDQVLDVIGR